MATGHMNSFQFVLSLKSWSKVSARSKMMGNIITHIIHSKFLSRGGLL